MSDLISRQAAIDAFGLSEKTRKYGGDHSGYDTMMLYEIQDTLESLPSAQPDYTAIKYEIQRNIDDFHNSEHHAQHVLSNGRMIAFGLELALDIIKDAERRKDGQK